MRLEGSVFACCVYLGFEMPCRGGVSQCPHCRKRWNALPGRRAARRFTGDLDELLADLVASQWTVLLLPLPVAWPLAWSVAWPVAWPVSWPVPWPVAWPVALPVALPVWVWHLWRLLWVLLLLFWSLAAVCLSYWWNFSWPGNCRWWPGSTCLLLFSKVYTFIHLRESFRQELTMKRTCLRTLSALIRRACA